MRPYSFKFLVFGAMFRKSRAIHANSPEKKSWKAIKILVIRRANEMTSPKADWQYRNQPIGKLFYLSQAARILESPRRKIRCN